MTVSQYRGGEEGGLDSQSSSHPLIGPSGQVRTAFAQHASGLPGQGDPPPTPPSPGQKQKLSASTTSRYWAIRGVPPSEKCISSSKAFGLTWDQEEEGGVSAVRGGGAAKCMS